ncbi:MAG: leucine--tRNA ligase [Fuerstiella sp.]|nr:leucine--tRNA ligase [Fuerstiella sp.]
MPRYDSKRIEHKWQEFWEENQTFVLPDRIPTDAAQKLYVLDMFPYPSGSGLHVGHPEGYTATDIVVRHARMNGRHVLHPMGWDSFGLPAEEHAVRTGTHPRETTEQNIETFRRQLKMLGFSYDWSREIATTDPEYYRWTQWIFLQLFDTWYDADCRWNGPDGISRTGKGRPIAELTIPKDVQDKGDDAVRRYQDRHRLAYISEAPVNWCPALGTVLANEEVIDGLSERGSHPVERIPLRQWMLRITKYADRLESELRDLNWPESIKLLQRNWIGRSTGANVDFFTGDGPFDAWRTQRTNEGWPEEPSDDVLRVYTTRPDTLYGATYMVIAPEHPLVNRLTISENQTAVQEYCRTASLKSELDRTDLAKEKSGVFTGSYAVNPVNGQQIPVWVADYVLISYGTGAIMAVPAHDLRDFEFAVQFNLPILPVVQPPEDWTPSKDEAALSINRNGQNLTPFSGLGKAINCGEHDGTPTVEFKAAITETLTSSGLGQAAVNYKLRDWLFSRQRYWGEPFPIWHELDTDGNQTGLMRAESEKNLPVPHPHMEDFKPTGTPQPMLSKASEEWLYKTAEDGTPLKRETNSMPQWAGSCWYYLRFCDPQNSDQFIDPAKEKYWLPVDLYIGGAEHAVLHLLYARFWHKLLFDRGHVSTPEPFNRLVNQGMILGENGEKMSKSRGNVINPDDVVNEYGADALRLYEMFMGPLEQVKPWSMKGVEGVFRFLGRVWRMVIDQRSEDLILNAAVSDSEPTEQQMRILHKTIKAVSADIERMSFNTAISRMMEFVNFMGHEDIRPKAVLEPFVLILSPFAPHIAEELWRVFGHTESLARESWPEHDESLLIEDTVEIPVQVNGRLRAKIHVPGDANQTALQSAAEADATVQQQLEGKNVVKVIAVPGRMVNFVVK